MRVEERKKPVSLCLLVTDFSSVQYICATLKHEFKHEFSKYNNVIVSHTFTGSALSGSPTGHSSAFVLISHFCNPKVIRPPVKELETHSQCI